ncbi:MAG TPA: hypothetical protein VJ729_12530 [Nitrososphaeraceae archaeon]|nr:hypothetical protein [Nitrososphaeraceae archaeon]
MIETSRKQKEKRILDLHNDGYTIRDIAQQEHKSFRDIGAIIEREQERQEAIERQTHQSDIASRAYSLFLKGKLPVEVAIELKLRQPDVRMLYGEYLKLVGLEKLHKVYEEVGEEIENFINLYKMMKASGINAPHVKRLIRIANEDLPSVDQIFQLANKRVMELQGDVRNSTFTFQLLSDGISSMNATLTSLQAQRQKAQEEIGELYQKRTELQGFVRHYENNNEGYLSIVNLAKEKVYSTLTENKLFLKLAVQSLVELVTSHPDKYRFLTGLSTDKNSLSSKQLVDSPYNDISLYNSSASFSSSTHTLPPILAIQTRQKEHEHEKEDRQPQQIIPNDSLEMLVQEGEEKLLENLVKQLAPAIITPLMLKFPRRRRSLPIVDGLPMVRNE